MSEQPSMLIVCFPVALITWALAQMGQPESLENNAALKVD